MQKIIHKKMYVVGVYSSHDSLPVWLHDVTYTIQFECIQEH